MQLFEDVARDVDVVLEPIGAETQDRSWKVLEKRGVPVSLIGPTSAQEAAEHGVRAVLLMGHASPSQSAEIAGLADFGRLNVIVDAVLPLSEARLAHELSESGHVGASSY
jgi:NADPH:quinone reductase-like Zn-dependent oxidoreductase